MFHEGEMPLKTDGFFISMPTSQSYQTRQPAQYQMTAARTNPWAVACYALAIIALFGTVVQTMVPFITGMLSILCGAIVLATALVERRQSGFWMALLGMAFALIPLLLAGMILFGR